MLDKRRNIETTADRVFNILAASPQPMGAYDVLECLTQSGRYDPTTVYRALARLVRWRCIHRLETLKAYVVLSPEPVLIAGTAQDTSALFMICDGCRSVNAINDLRLSRLIDRCATVESFMPRTGTIEVLGLCANCRDRVPEVTICDQTVGGLDQRSSGAPS